MKLRPTYLAVALLLLSRPATAGPPFRTDDPQPVDFGHWEFYVASQQEFLREETGATCPHFEVNYGAAPDLQLHVVAPLGYVHGAQGTRYGFGDTEIGAKYRFVEETDATPQIGVFPMLEIPTGSESRGLGNGRFQAYLPAWVQKSWGRLTSYAGAGWWYNPGPDRKNWLFAGWEAQYDFSETLTLGGELFWQSADSPDSSPGSGFNIGGYLNLDEHNHILFSVGHSIAGESAVTGYVGYQMTI